MILLQSFTFMLFVVSCGTEVSILDLTEANFIDIVRAETAVVRFFNSSKEEHLNEQDTFEVLHPSGTSRVVFARADCFSRAQEICKRFNVDSLPTVKWFKNGTLFHRDPSHSAITKYVPFKIRYTQRGFVSTYRREDDAEKVLEAVFDSAIAFVNAPKSIKKNKVLTQYTNSNLTSVVGYFIRKSPTMKAFVETGVAMHDRAEFGICMDENILRRQAHNNSIVLYRAVHLRNVYENDSVRYKGRLDVPRIERFVIRESHGLVGHRTEENRKEFSNPLVVVYYNLDFSKLPDQTNAVRNKILKVAKRFHRQVSFAVSSRYDFKHELRQYGLGKLKGRTMALATDTRNKTYTFNDEIRMLEAFVDDFRRGALAPALKSQPVPKQNSDAVKIVVGKNAEEVLSNDKNIVIQLYKTGCKSSVAFDPAYKRLAIDFEDRDVIFAKMDVTANDVPLDLGVKDYPAIIWLGKDKGRKLYDDKWSEEALSKFVDREANAYLLASNRNGKSKNVKTDL